MSNHRRPARLNSYRGHYLHSPTWFARRTRWFAEEQLEHGEVRCALCRGVGTDRTFELHHLDYRGVIETSHGWAAHEHHDDLVALHPRCHEWVHTLIDRDKALSGLVSRRTASAQAIARLRAKIAQTLTDGESA